MVLPFCLRNINFINCVYTPDIVEVGTVTCFNSLHDTVKCLTLNSDTKDIKDLLITKLPKDLVRLTLHSINNISFQVDSHIDSLVLDFCLWKVLGIPKTVKTLICSAL